MKCFSTKIFQWITLILIISLFLFSLFQNSKERDQKVWLSGSFFDTTSSQIILTGSQKPTERLTRTVSDRVTQIISDKEVQKTLERISKERPLYHQDGAVFQNREKRLPIKKDRSYYHEWTIRTPDSIDRWTRRIIEGKNGELYFTDDHYNSFVAIY
jgi:guanyl-specific ribonuclease Sa